MRDKQIKFIEFTKPEINFFLDQCNFSCEEEQLFLIRSSKNNFTLQATALQMHVSLRTATSINKAVKRKIRKVLESL